MQISRGIGVSKGNFLKESMKKLEFLERLREGGRNQKKNSYEGYGYFRKTKQCLLCIILIVVWSKYLPVSIIQGIMGRARSELEMQK